MARHDPEIERFGQVLDKSLKRMEISTRLDEYGVLANLERHRWYDHSSKCPTRKNSQWHSIRQSNEPGLDAATQYMKEMIAEKLNQRLKTRCRQEYFFRRWTNPY